MQHTILPKFGARKFRPEICRRGCFAMRLPKSSCWLLCIILSFVVSIWGQETTGTITGLISDPSGAVVPNVELTVVNVGTSATFKTSTNSAGTYIFRTLPVGAYR